MLSLTWLIRINLRTNSQSHEQPAVYFNMFHRNTSIPLQYATSEWGLTFKEPRLPQEFGPSLHPTKKQVKVALQLVADMMTSGT